MIKNEDEKNMIKNDKRNDECNDNQNDKKWKNILFKDFQCVAGSFFISLHHGRYSMALFLHVLSPQNDVALVRPMTPKITQAF